MLISAVVSFDLVAYKLYHLPRHPRIDTHPEGISHNPVGVRKPANGPVASVIVPHFIKAWVFDEVSGKKHAGLNAVGFQMRHYIIPGKSGVFPDGVKKTKPAPLLRSVKMLNREGRESGFDEDQKRM
jgi:hypothetical protein